MPLTPTELARRLARLEQPQAAWRTQSMMAQNVAMHRRTTLDDPETLREVLRILVGAGVLLDKADPLGGELRAMGLWPMKDGLEPERQEREASNGGEARP